VAAAVAEAGPWNASMDMVARRSGLSKSGLYAHFKNKQDMLAQLFITEFERILHYVELNKEKSEVPLEKLYLTIITAANYLRARPEILAAIGWIKTRKLDLGRPALPRIYRLLSNIDRKIQDIRQDDPDSETGRNSQWLLFLIVNMLTSRPSGVDWVSDESFRILFRFMACGLGAVFNLNSVHEGPEEKIAL
jgi:AcrR family transcriptional regulator